MTNGTHKSLSKISRRSLLAVTVGAALSGFPRGILPALAQGAVESQLHMMGWADYIGPDNISAWEKANNSKLIYDSYASNDEMYSKLQLSQPVSGFVAKDFTDISFHADNDS